MTSSKNGGNKKGAALQAGESVSKDEGNQEKNRIGRKMPDFMQMLESIYGKRKMKVSGAEIVSMQRGDY